MRGVRRAAERPRQPRARREDPGALRARRHRGEAAGELERRRRAGPASGRSPSPHMCIARCAGYSSPASHRSCASNASSPAAEPAAPLDQRDVAQRRPAEAPDERRGVVRRRGRRHPTVSACSKSVGQVVERAHRGERARVDASRASTSPSSSVDGCASRDRCVLDPRTAGRPRRQRAQRAGDGSFSARSALGKLGARRAGRRPARASASTPSGSIAEVRERPPARRAVRVEVRAPRVGARRTGHPRHAARRHPLARSSACARSRCGIPSSSKRASVYATSGDGVGGGDPAHHADERRCGAVDVCVAVTRRAGRRASRRGCACRRTG